MSILEFLFFGMPVGWFLLMSAGGLVIFLFALVASALERPKDDDRR